MESLHDFIDCDKLDFMALMVNPHPLAGKILEEVAVDFTILAQNKSAWMLKRLPKKLSSLDIQYLSKNPQDEVVDKLLSREIPIDWCSFSSNTNPRAVDYMEENMDKVSRVRLNENSSAGRLLEEKYIDRLICKNTSDEAMEMLDRNPRYIDLYLLVENSNPRALEILLKHGYSNQITTSISSVVLNNLAKNTNPQAMKLLTSNLENFQWGGIWSNPSPEAFELIWACYTNTWKEKYCKFISPDVIETIEERLNTAKEVWAIKQMCKNTNPQILEILKFYPRYIDYESISANPIIFK